MMKLFIAFILPIIILFTLACDKEEKLPELETLQQKLLRCIYSDVTFPKQYWILLSGSEFTVMDFIILKPFDKDSITVLSCKVAIADTNYVDNKNEFLGNCPIKNDITGKSYKLYFTNTTHKNVSKRAVQFNELLKKTRNIGDIGCHGHFDPVTINLSEVKNKKLKTINICKDSEHPLNTLFKNITTVQ